MEKLARFVGRSLTGYYFRTMNRPLTAVIILNWNGASLLKEFLPSVIAGTDPTDATVIVADNGSTDDSRHILEKEFPDVRTILLDKNYGFAEGYNRTIDLVADEFRYVVLLNSDVAVEPGWIVALNSFMEEHPEAGACQPKILSYNNREYFEYAGASGGFIDRNGYPFCRGRIFSTCEKDEGQYDQPVQIFWASGAALMVRSSLYKKAGGLDADFFAHMEEIDLCWRIHLAGQQIWAVPQSVVFHLGGGSLPAENPKKTYLNFRNNLLLLHKNLPDATRNKKLFRRRMLDTLAWLKFMLTLDLKNANAVLRAHRDFRKMAKRYTNHPETDLLDTRDDTQVNILSKYYLRGISKFSRL